MRSAPQKQPRPTTSWSWPSGNGATSEWPFTKCGAGSTIACSRPPSAASGSIIVVLGRENSMGSTSHELGLGAHVVTREVGAGDAEAAGGPQECGHVVGTHVGVEGVFIGPLLEDVK